MDWNNWIPRSSSHKEHMELSVSQDAPIASSTTPSTNDMIQSTQDLDPFDNDDDTSPEFMNAVTALFQSLGVED
jgi:hypothetical protein